MLTIGIRILCAHSLEHHFRNWQLNETQLLEGIYQRKKKRFTILLMSTEQKEMKNEEMPLFGKRIHP